MAKRKGAPLLSLTDERRDDLTELLITWVRTGLGEREPLEGTWDYQRDQYNDEPLPFVSNFLPSVMDKCYSFAGPRIDALGDNVNTAVFGQDPILAATNRTTRENVNQIERIVQYFFRQGKLEEVMKSIQPDVGTTNHGIVRQTVDPERMLFKYDPMPPEDLVVLGSGSYNLDTCEMAGHIFHPSIGEVLRRMKAGEYYEHPDNDEYQPNKSPDASETATSETGSASTDELTAPCDIWCIHFKCDWSKLEDRKSKRGVARVSNKEEYYVAHLDMEGRFLLSVRLAPAKRPPYYSFGYLPNPTRGFWNKRSIGNKLQQLHDAYQICNNTIMYGSLLVAFRPIISKGPFMKHQSYGVASMVATQGGEVTMPNLSFDAAGLENQKMTIERVGDSAVRISQAGQAMPTAVNKTATQVMQEAKGEATGQSGYVGTFTIPLCEMGKEVILYVSALWPEFLAIHGEALMQPQDTGQVDPMTGQPVMAPPILSPEEAVPQPWPYGDPMAIDFEAIGASPSSNPIFMMGIGEKLLAIAQTDPIEWNIREVYETIAAATGLRNSDRFLRTPEEVAAIKAEQAQAAADAAKLEAEKGQGMADDAATREHQAFQAGLSGEPDPTASKNGQGVASMLGGIG